MLEQGHLCMRMRVHADACACRRAAHPDEAVLYSARAACTCMCTRLGLRCTVLGRFGFCTRKRADGAHAQDWYWYWCVHVHMCRTERKEGCYVYGAHFGLIAERLRHVDGHRKGNAYVGLRCDEGAMVCGQ